MNYTIENEQLKVEVSDLGAEMRSLVGKKSGFEYLWQGDPTFWQNRATVLFPICGRLFEGKYTYGGRTYEMVLHGIAKLQTYSVIAHTAHSLTLECRANDETRAVYPFDFIFRMTYTLHGASVIQRYEVVNSGSGDLPFTVGGHPGFNIPFVDGESFEDYYLEFPEASNPGRLRMSATCFYLGEDDPYPLRDGKFLDLRHDLFDDDAIFLSGMPKEVALKSGKNDRAVTVRYDDMRHVGFWHKPHSEAPYVCIEPWNGTPSYDGRVDDFADKNEMFHIQPGETYTAQFSISVTE